MYKVDISGSGGLDWNLLLSFLSADFFLYYVLYLLTSIDLDFPNNTLSAQNSESKVDFENYSAPI